MGLPDHGQVVEGAFGAQLLNHADDRVGDDQDRERPLGELHGCGDDHEQHRQHRVHAREHVVADDLPGGAPRTLRQRVDLSLPDPLRHLVGGQAPQLTGHDRWPVQRV
jgi:hypothetical protein